jgi:hypothetical protein
MFHPSTSEPMFIHTGLTTFFVSYLVQIITVLLLLPDTHVNALNRDHKTAYDIAEGLPVCEESCEIKDILSQHGALRSRELNQPRDELRKTVTEIKKDVHTQLEQTRRTNKNVHGIAKELRKLHREGINNATNSVTVVAVLFATVAFAAIFTVSGGYDDSGLAVVVHRGEATASYGGQPTPMVSGNFNRKPLFNALVAPLKKCPDPGGLDGWLRPWLFRLPHLRYSSSSKL